MKSPKENIHTIRVKKIATWSLAESSIMMLPLIKDVKQRPRYTNKNDIRGIIELNFYSAYDTLSTNTAYMRINVGAKVKKYIAKNFLTN
ncbi:hypothetical protein Tcan_02897 [Toxocara canis]|uniref:Uncharacterized protein n=1 Tax=Toxocara canis TaxID=6265 RepID=A0A0B2VKS1_TOXCA|nr:hypothetical protein Tcan_02897 [Toxocara canis]